MAFSLCAGPEVRMTDPDLTQELIDEAMVRAEKATCSQLNHRCVPWRWGLVGRREQWRIMMQATQPANW